MKIKLECKTCLAPVYRNPFQITKSKSGFVFCSKTCAAIFNNTVSQKRKLNKICKNPTCNNLILSNRAYCETCYIEKHYLANKTLEEATRNRKDSNRYTGIRGNGRNVYYNSNRPKHCVICGYDKHIEICHIKDIASFPLATLIKEINSINNLAALCPNHHWEFDNGFIPLPILHTALGHLV